MRVGGTVVLFARDAQPLHEIRITADRPEQCLVLNAVPGGVYRFGRRRLTATSAGVLSFELPKGAQRILRIRSGAAR